MLITPKVLRGFMVLLLCLSAAGALDAADRLALVCKYENERYGYSIKYPDIFDKKIESDSGDGVTLSSKDGKYKLLIWGGYNVLSDTPDTLLASAAKTARENGGKTVSGQAGKNSCYLVSHNEKKGSISYHMTFVNDDDIKAFLFTYPKAEEKQFEKVIKEMKASF